MAYKPPPELKSRVESIKKKFETGESPAVNVYCSNTHAANSDGSKKNQSKCHNVSREGQSVAEVVVSPEKCKDKLKATSSYLGKGNIRRTPAFRCEKSVLTHTSVKTGKNSFVDSNVKLFEDQHHNNSTNSRIIPNKIEKDVARKDERKEERCASKPAVKSRNHLMGRNTANASVSISKVNANNQDSKYNVLSPRLQRTIDKDLAPPTPVRKPVVSMKFENVFHKTVSQDDEKLKEKEIIESVNCEEKKRPEKINVGEANLTCSLRAALKAPLPPGPPPKKPPRTFIHNSPQGNAKPASPSVTVKELEKEISLGNPPVKHTKKVLTRSTTEPHLMLKKIENVLLKHQQGIGNVVIMPRAFVETKGKAFSPDTKSSTSRFPPSSQGLHISTDISSKEVKSEGNSDKIIGGCFESLNCVSNVPKHLYEKPSESRSEFFLDSPFCSEQKNCVPSGVKRGLDQPNVPPLNGKHSYDEPVYTEPYACVDIDSILRAELSLEETKNFENPPVLGTTCAKVGEQKSSTLHYMCSPINPLDRMDALLNSSGVNVTNNSVSNSHSQIMFCEKRENCDSVECKREEKPLPQKSFLHFSNLSKNQQNTSANVPQKLDRSKLQIFINQAFGSPLHDSPVASLDSASSDESFPTTPDEMNSNPQNEVGSSGKRDDGNDSLTTLQNGNSSESSHSKHQDMTKLTEERKVYVRRVSSRIFNTRQRLVSKPFSNLFHCIMLIGLNLDGEKKTKVPYIKSKYPVHAPVPPHIEHFCFPDATDWPSKKSSTAAGSRSDEQSYSLVITNEIGEHTFGYCRRVLPEGTDICLPLAYCILSPYRAKGFYFKILSELESQHGQQEWLQKTFIKELYACEFPSPGQTLKLANTQTVPGNVETLLNNLALQLRRPVDTRLEEHDLTQLFSTLTVSILLQVFGSLLLERKVLFISDSLSKLSSCIEGLHSILYPFSWQYTFIPVLPSAQIIVCEAPFPFIIGLLKDKSGKSSAVSLEEGIIVDLEEPKIVQCMGDESSILPPRLKKCLKMALQLVESTTEEAEPARNVLISEAFVRMFVEVCGHYANHIVTQQDGKKVFEKESFIKAVPQSAVQLFLEWFTETAMFSCFVESRLNEGYETKGLFEQRALEHSEQMDKNTALFLRNYKAIDKKVKSFGNRFKDWTPFT